MMMRKNLFIALLAIGAGLNSRAQSATVTLTIPEKKFFVDPMIYGEMLENVNDSVIYGGITDVNGNARPYVTQLIKDLNIPVMRWPGGTVVHEYRWRNGIGPKNLRPVVTTYAWKGRENYQFGTDEFLQWCSAIGTEPYINLNMGNHPEYQGTLWEALEWIEYVNGSADSSHMGKLRALYGHPQPYHVKYWGIGNENYGPWGRHSKESDTVYAEKLNVWAGAIKRKYPELNLLGVGHTLGWNKTVLEKNAAYLDFLTQHYYVVSKIKDGKLQSPDASLFAPARMEKHLELLGKQLDEINQQLNRTTHPIRLSVDEWNNRHAVFEEQEFRFTRQSPRRQFDVAVAAGMLNVFIRQCHTVGMANYIFPVNGHGLIRTLNNNDAFVTPLYYLFKAYREWMTGQRIDVTVQGPGIMGSAVKTTIEGDCQEMELDNQLLPFIDAAGVMTANKAIHVALVNRSALASQKIQLSIPKGYKIAWLWEMGNSDINAFNSPDNRYHVQPAVHKISGNKKINPKIILPACGIAILELVND